MNLLSRCALVVMLFLTGCVVHAQYNNPILTGTVQFKNSSFAGSTARFPPTMLGSGVPSSSLALFGDGVWRLPPSVRITAINGTPGEIDSLLSGTTITLSLPAALVLTGKTIAGGTFNSPTINTATIDTAALTGVTSFSTLLSAVGSTPASPAPGTVVVYVDGTQILSSKTNAGVVTHMVQTKNSQPHQFLTAISIAGVVSTAAPVQADITGLTTGSNVVFNKVTAQVPQIGADVVANSGSHTGWVTVSSGTMTAEANNDFFSGLEIINNMNTVTFTGQALFDLHINELFPPSGTGTLTEHIGLLIEDIYVTPGGNRYAIYSSGGAPSYFGGSLITNSNFSAAGYVEAAPAGTSNTIRMVGDSAAPTYGMLSFNNSTSSASAIYIKAGGGIDNNIYYGTPSGGGHKFLVNGTDLGGFASTGFRTTTPIQNGGMVITSSDFPMTTTTLADITGLTETLLAGVTYHFKAHLMRPGASVTSANGIKVAVGGTCTATSMVANVGGSFGTSGTNYFSSTVSALGSAVSNTPVGSAVALDLTVDGTIVVNAGGTLTIQAAQVTASGTTTVGAGSYLEVSRI